MRRAFLLMATGLLAGCGGGSPATKVTGECAAQKKLTFAPVSVSTLRAALGPGTYRRVGPVFPGKGSRVSGAAICAYQRGGKYELTVGLDHKTDFFTSVGEARRLQHNPLVKPIAGLDGYAFEEVAAGQRSAWAVALGPRSRITWAHVRSPPSGRDATGAAIAALKEAVTAFNTPMKAKRP